MTDERHEALGVPWPKSSVQTPCPLVRAKSGRASPGLGEQRRPSPQWAVWTPQDAPFCRAQAMQQPQPGSLSTCWQSAGTAGHPSSFSSVQGAQRIGSGPATGEGLTLASAARDATVATKMHLLYTPVIFRLEVRLGFGLGSSLFFLSSADCSVRLVLFLLKGFPRSGGIYAPFCPHLRCINDWHTDHRYKLFCTKPL